MHRRTASALGQVPAPSRSIDFRAVSAPPGWGRVIPFVPRRKAPPVSASAEVKPDSVQEVGVVASTRPDESIADKIAYQRFLMGEGGDIAPPAVAGSREKFVGIPQKPTSHAEIAAAIKRYDSMPFKAQRRGTKLRGAVPLGINRPKVVISSSQFGIYHASVNSGGSRAQRPPKKATPPLVIDDALFQAAVERAWVRCKPPHIAHPDRVLSTALMICGSGSEGPDAVNQYLVRCLYTEVQIALVSQKEVTRGLIRKIVDRSLGLLIKWVRACVKASILVDDDKNTALEDRYRSNWAKRRSSAVHRGLSLHLCSQPELTEGKSVYLLLDCSQPHAPVVHKLMAADDFARWSQKPKYCCASAVPGRIRVVPMPAVDDEAGLLD